MQIALVLTILDDALVLTLFDDALVLTPSACATTSWRRLVSAHRQKVTDGQLVARSKESYARYVNSRAGATLECHL